MKNNIKKVKRTVRDILFLHVFRLDNAKLLATAGTLFTLSLVLLFISIIFTFGFVFSSNLPIEPEVKSVYSNLDNCSIISSLSLLLAVIVLVFVKAGAFEKHMARLIWHSYVFIFIGALFLTIILISLVFENPWFL